LIKEPGKKDLVNGQEGGKGWKLKKEKATPIIEAVGIKIA